MSARTVTDLQRELLAVIRGSTWLATYARLHGYAGSDGVDLRGELNRSRRVRELRLQIHALDPKAALYFCWDGGREAERELQGILARRQTAGCRA